MLAAGVQNWGAGSRQTSPGMLLGTSQGQGNVPGVLSTHTPLKAGEGAWHYLPAGMACSPPLRQPIPEAGKMQLGFFCASLHWLSWVPAQPPTLALSLLHVMALAAPQFPQPQPLRRAALGKGMAGVPVGMHDWPLPPSKGDSAGGRGAALRTRVWMGSTGLPVLVPGEPLHPCCTDVLADRRCAAQCQGVLGER